MCGAATLGSGMKVLTVGHLSSKTLLLSRGCVHLLTGVSAAVQLNCCRVKVELRQESPLIYGLRWNFYFRWEALTLVKFFIQFVIISKLGRLVDQARSPLQGPLLPKLRDASSGERSKK